MLNNQHIKIFKVDKYFYIFDYKNFLINTSDYSGLKTHHFSEHVSDIISSYNVQHKAGNKIIYSTIPLSFKMPPYISRNDIYLKMFKYYHRYLQLILTEQCNLRCKYCFYTSSSYLNYRSHSDSVLDYSIAEEAVNNLLSNSHRNNFTIAFFGGEPLLEFRTIKRIIDYVKRTFPDKEVFFRFSTNGTLLDRNIIKFMVNNNVDITISLDGNKEIHDEKRVFRNGRPTFDLIMKNINFIKANYQDYFKKHIKLHGTVSSYEEYIECHHEFQKMKVCEASVNSYVKGSERYSDITFSLKEDFLAQFIKSYENMDMQSLYTYKTAFLEFCFSLERLIFYKKTKGPLGGFCVPYYVKTNLHPDGKITYCDFLENLPMGSFDSEYHINHADIKREFVKVIEYRNKYCKYCWLRDLCKMCWVQMYNPSENRLSIKHFTNNCNNFKLQSSFKMQIYLILIKYDKNIFMNISKYFEESRYNITTFL